MDQLEVKNDFVEMNVEKNSITMKPIKKENYTIENLKQHLIEMLMKNEYYEMSEVEVIKALLENEKY